MTGSAERLFRKIAVIGQGYVGLPLALLFAKKGFTVLGIDVDSRKIEALRQGQSYLPDVRDEEIESSISAGQFYPTDRFSDVTEADAIVICVPTPLNTQHSPDLTILEKAVGELGTYLRRGQLVILESSTFPGTTRDVVRPALEKGSGMTAGIDFFIGYSPERIDPGNDKFGVEQIPKVVSGLSAECLEYAGALYSRIFDEVVTVSSLEVAELTKLLENSHRLINISFINEFASICDELNIDVWEVIAAAKTKPFGFTPYYPGPGIGGHCIPVDPLYLQWKAQKSGVWSKFIQIADEVNRSMPAYVADRVKALLVRHSAPEHAHVFIYGVAYKKDINDVRESPALELIPLLVQSGYDVSYHDPYIPEIEAAGRTYRSVDMNEDTLRSAHCVIIFTDHSVIPVEAIVAAARLVFDTRNATSGVPHHGNVIRMGAGEGAL